MARKRNLPAVKKILFINNMRNLPKRKKIKELFRPIISLPEGELKDRIFRAGLRPISQFKIGKYYVDFAFPDYLLAVEYDGKIHLDNPVKDYKRHKEIEKMGWHILRIMNKEKGYVVMFDFQEIGFTKYQEMAMELVIEKIKEFIRGKKEKDPNWMVNFSIGQPEKQKEIKDFNSMKDSLEDWFAKFEEREMHSYSSIKP